MKATAQQAQNLASTAINALTLAQSAMDQAKAALVAAGIDPTVHGLPSGQVAAQAAPAANKSGAGTRSGTSSGGRTPSPVQIQIRDKIVQWCASNKAGLFTNKMMVEHLGTDKIQTRNAINALTEQGVILRWAEKFAQGPGAREIIYIPAGFNPGL